MASPPIRGTLQEAPSETVWFGENGVFSCLIRTYRTPEGVFHGHLHLAYPGDGFSLPHTKITVARFDTAEEAIEAVKPLIESLAAEWVMYPPEEG